MTDKYKSSTYVLSGGNDRRTPCPLSLSRETKVVHVSYVLYRDSLACKECTGNGQTCLRDITLSVLNQEHESDHEDSWWSLSRYLKLSRGIKILLQYVEQSGHYAAGETGKDCNVLLRLRSLPTVGHIKSRRRKDLLCEMSAAVIVNNRGPLPPQFSPDNNSFRLTSESCSFFLSFPLVPAGTKSVTKCLIEVTGNIYNTWLMSESRVCRSVLCLLD